MLGYYKSSFPKKDGSGKAYYGLTQFEPCTLTFTGFPLGCADAFCRNRPGPPRFRTC